MVSASSRTTSAPSSRTIVEPRWMMSATKWPGSENSASPIYASSADSSDRGSSPVIVNSMSCRSPSKISDFQSTDVQQLSKILSFPVLQRASSARCNALAALDSPSRVTSAGPGHGESAESFERAAPVRGEDQRQNAGRPSLLDQTVQPRSAGRPDIVPLLEAALDVPAPYATRHRDTFQFISYLSRHIPIDRTNHAW